MDRAAQMDGGMRGLGPIENHVHGRDRNRPPRLLEHLEELSAGLAQRQILPRRPSFDDIVAVYQHRVTEWLLVTDHEIVVYS